MIELQSVRFAYGPDTVVLRDVSLRIGGGLTLVLGPNGAGKSTLLKLVAGVERPAGGRLLIAGADLWEDEVAARSSLAYLPEHPDLTPYATVAEILDLVGALRGASRADADNALRWVGLGRLGGRTVRELSKGQRRRAVLAAARIGQPACLILDEPLDGMDREIRVRLLDWIAVRRAAGATLLVVSHDPGAFVHLADQAISVRGGICTQVEPLPATAPERLAVLEALAQGMSTEA